MNEKLFKIQQVEKAKADQSVSFIDKMFRRKELIPMMHFIILNEKINYNKNKSHEIFGINLFISNLYKRHCLGVLNIENINSKNYAIQKVVNHLEIIEDSDNICDIGYYNTSRAKIFSEW